MNNLFQQGAFGQAVEFRPLRVMGQGKERLVDRPQFAQPIQPTRLSPSTDRFQWTVSRICSIMERFSGAGVEPEVQSQVFWSYVKQAQSSEESVIAAYKAACPTLPVPAKPATPDKELKEDRPDKVGFHGKTQISYAEAVELNTALEEVLRPLTPEEAASAIGKTECLRDFAAGNFPKVERLQADLQAFVDAGDTGGTFTISKGDIVVAGKAIDCAVALGRGKVIKAALVTGGVVGAGALLFLLL
jgi:hypothetical protein